MDPETKDLFERFAHTQEFLRQSIESHDRQLGEITQTIGEIAQSIRANDRQIDKLTTLIAEDSENIRALARIAEAHQERLDDIEGKSS